MKKQRAEILAPAGTMNALRDGVLAGADAVYLGGQALNARRNAANFTRDDLAQAVAFCHLYGAKAYLTLNTLMFDEEVPQVLDEIAHACSIGFDAIIVQDYGVVRLLKQCAPEMPLFASTQMSVHNLADARALEESGFQRVVLARELHKKEIAHILQNSTIETEVFVHGALCYAISGQCYFSAFLGERSGNRGLCAQVCRLPFGTTDSVRHNLSLKDLSLIDYARELSDMGVTSFKIEGRMKSAQYVSATVSAFQNALSGRPYEKDVLGNIFSRTGFTDGYYTGRIDGKMFGIRREKDKALSQTTSSTTPPIEKTIPIEMDYTISTTECTLIVCDDDGHQAHSSFPPAERALNKPLTPESIEQNLAKTLNTPYRIRHLRGSVADDVFLPIAKINEMRRSALARLSEKRTAFQTYAFYAPDKKTAPPRTLHTPALTASFKNIKQFMPEFLSDLKYASFDLFTLLTVDSSFIASCKDKLVAELPRVYFDDEAKLETALRKLKELGVNKAKCHSPGRMHLAQNAGFDVIGGFGLNLANSEALAQLTQHDPLYLTLSAEMKRSDIAALRYAGKTAIIAYGYFPLMISRNCPIKPETGCSNCPGRLVDRKGVSFPVLCDGDTVEILNSVPLYLADKPAWFSTTDYLDLSFTIETTQECKEILHRYKNHMSTTTLFTRGIYNRGVL